MYTSNRPFDKVIVECFNPKIKEIEQLTGHILNKVSATERDYRLNVKLADGRELAECAPECVKPYYMRSVSVTYSDGSVIDTNINGTYKEIKQYFAIGRHLNIGSNTDNVRAVTKYEVL